jgi:hypothetical protein
VPAIFTVESHDQVPVLPLTQLHDVGLVLPVSKDPFGAMLGTVAGSSRNINPDLTPAEAYSTPFD